MSAQPDDERTDEPQGLSATAMLCVLWFALAPLAWVWSLVTRK